MITHYLAPLERDFLAGKADGSIPDAIGWRTYQQMAERQQRLVADVLLAFFRSELSASSVQPVLDLAIELNPGLAHDQRRA